MRKRIQGLFFCIVFLMIVGFQSCSWKNGSLQEDEGVDVSSISADEGELSEDGEPVEEVPEEVSGFKDVNHWNLNRILPASDLPLVVNDRVLAWMEYFTGRGRPVFEKWLARKTYVEPMFQKALQEEGLPVDLIYLSMIESGFNPKAFSRARASGPWQFMTGTARLYDLRVDDWVDERRDPEKSTHAAARHLRDLYANFGDWYLAAAAYNAGTGKVERAIKRHGTRDFWELANVRRPYLRAETRNYVPKLLAALIIAKQPEYFGFNSAPEGTLLEEIHSEEHIKKVFRAITDQNFDLVTVDDATDLRVIAQCSQVDVEEIKHFNPEIRYWFTPPHDKSYALRLPKGTKDIFAANFAEIPSEKRLTFRSHVLRQGETLGQVARAYGTNINSIMQLNQIRDAKKVRAGKLLYIPMPRGLMADGIKVKSSPRKLVAKKSVAKPTLVSTASLPKDQRAIEIQVQSGDTLWQLAQKYSVSVKSIKKWNSLSNSRRIFPGDMLTIYVNDV